MLKSITKILWSIFISFSLFHPLLAADAEELPDRIAHEYLLKVVSKSSSPQALNATSLDSDVAKSLNDLGIEIQPALTRHAERSNSIGAVAALSQISKVHYLKARVSASLGLDSRAEYEILSNHPGVVAVSPNYVYRTLQSNADPLLQSSGTWKQPYSDLWNIHRIRAPEAWQISRGAGVTVAVIDTGVDYNHPELQANMWTNSKEIPGNGVDDDANGFIDDINGYDFTTCEKITSTGCSQAKGRDADALDQHGHGTHCAGIVAAKQGNGMGIAGVAPDSKIMAIRSLNSEGSGNLIDLAEGLIYAIENGADVINASWGGSALAFVFDEILEEAQQRGILVVAAAGNENQLVYTILPGGSHKVLTVGSSDVNDRKSSFSNFSESPLYDGGLKKFVEIAAPGGGGTLDGTPEVKFESTNILSLRAANTDMYSASSEYVPGSFIVSDPATENKLYYRARGTSMAAPAVSGAAAVLLSYLRANRSQGSLTNSQYKRALFRELKAKLIESGKSIPGLSTDSAWIGQRRLDVLSALQSTLTSRYVPIDDQIEEIGGNANAIVESGEAASLVITMRREFGDSTSVTGELIANEGAPVSLKTSSVQFTLNADQDQLSNSAQPFTFDAGIINFQTPVGLTLKLSTQSGSVTYPLTLYLGARRLSATALYIKENLLGGYAPLQIPSISDHRVVWADYRYGQSDVMSFDFRTRKTSLISREGSTDTPHQANQLNPVIFGDTIAWQDDRDGNWDIRIGSLNALGSDRSLTLGDLTAQNQYQPVMDGNNLFFTNEAKPGQFDPDLKVMHYDISANKLTKLSTVGSQFNASISRTSAVWENSSALGLEIVPDLTKINIRTALQLPIFPFRWPIEPAIDGNKIVFINGSFGAGRDLFLVELKPNQSENIVRQLTSDTTDQWRPQIHKNIIVWGDQRTSTWQVRAYDIAKEREYVLSTPLRASGVPNIRDGYVTWIQRGGLWITQLPGFAVVATPTPEPTPNHEATPQSTPTGGNPNGEIKISVKKDNAGVKNVVDKKNRATRIVKLVSDGSKRFEQLRLFLIPRGKESCAKPLAVISSLQGSKSITIKIPMNLNLSQVTLELRASNGTALSRARMKVPLRAGVKLIAKKKGLNQICRTVTASLR